MTTLNYHFSGVAGAGMNPLARLMRARGHRVQGSDRALDQGLMLETAALLRGEGIEPRCRAERRTFDTEGVGALLVGGDQQDVHGRLSMLRHPEEAPDGSPTHAG